MTDKVIITDSKDKDQYWKELANLCEQLFNKGIKEFDFDTNKEKFFFNCTFDDYKFDLFVDHSHLSPYEPIYHFAIEKLPVSSYYDSNYYHNHYFTREPEIFLKYYDSFFRKLKIEILKDKVQDELQKIKYIKLIEIVKKKLNN